MGNNGAKGEKGDKGDKGKTGPEGDKGDAGKNGIQVTVDYLKHLAKVISELEVEHALDDKL